MFAEAHSGKQRKSVAGEGADKGQEHIQPRVLQVRHEDEHREHTGHHQSGEYRHGHLLHLHGLPAGDGLPKEQEHEDEHAAHSPHDAAAEVVPKGHQRRKERSIDHQAPVVYCLSSAQQLIGGNGTEGAERHGQDNDR